MGRAVVSIRFATQPTALNLMTLGMGVNTMETRNLHGAAGLMLGLGLLALGVAALPAMTVPVTPIGADETGLIVIKQAAPDPVQAGAQLVYTIRVTNTGDVDLHATITDTLPISITSGQTSGGTAIVPGGQITWTAIITAPAGVWTHTFVVTVETGYVGPLTNVVKVTTDEGATGIYTETSTAIVLHPVYLPLVTGDVPTTTTVAGYYVLVGNPCTTDPCLPGVVYAVLVDDTYYHLTVKGSWLWVNRSWDGYTPEVGDFVTVTGYVEEMVDIFGAPFYNIEVVSLEPAPPPPATTWSIIVVDVLSYGTGSQEPDEYVEIRNDDTQPVQLQDWTLRDTSNHVFTFPNHLVQPGEVCRIYTNEDHPEWCGFSYSSESAIWDYAHDCAYLRDSVGTLIAAHCYCQSHTAYMTISATATTLEVGKVVTVTATLFNRGCVGLGLPQYRLYVQCDEPEAIFDPDNPEPVVHYLGIAPGQSDAAEFVLRAVESGQATLRATASFEVHLGYPGPAYWGYGSTGPLTMTVTP